MSETQLLFVKQSAANSENKKVHITRSAAYWHLWQKKYRYLF